MASMRHAFDASRSQAVPIRAPMFYEEDLHVFSIRFLVALVHGRAYTPALCSFLSVA